MTAQPADPAIWCLDLRRIALDAMRALLSADEQARADRFRMPDDIDRFTKSRGALRLILAARMGREPRDLAFVEGDGRKPALRDDPSVEFNLSHSGDYALIAVGTEPVGVDIEAIREIDWSGLAAMNFHTDERAALAACPDKVAARDAFFQFWAHKEAFLKAIGIGLTDQLTLIRVPPEGGLIAAPDAMSSGTWYATPLDAPEGYKASIVTRGAGISAQVRHALAPSP